MPLPITTRTRFTAARPKAGHTDLNPTSIATRLNLRTRRPELVSVVSADGVWRYERVEDISSTWTALHVESGLSLTHLPSLLAARRWTHDTPAALADLRHTAALAARPKCTWSSQITASVCADPADTTGRCGNPRHRIEVAA